MLRKHVKCTGESRFDQGYENIINRFPKETLNAVLVRVLTGTELEKKVYTDIFNINEFTYGLNNNPTVDSVRQLNAFALASDLIDDIPWFGWEATRAVITDALTAIPWNQVRLSEMDSHRLRSAVLVNCVVDRSDRHDSYSRIVDFFEKNYDAVYANLPALIERHKELGEVSLELVEDIMGGIPMSMVEGTL